MTKVQCPSSTVTDALCATAGTLSISFTHIIRFGARWVLMYLLCRCELMRVRDELTNNAFQNGDSTLVLFEMIKSRSYT